MNTNKTIRPDLVLINPPYHKRNNSGSVFPLGLGYISASARSAGFNVFIIDCASICHSLYEKDLLVFKKWLIINLKKINPKLAIGIGPCTTPAIKGIKAVAEVCKKVFPSLPLIYGGPLASINNQISIFFNQLYATAAVSGDGEKVICDILIAIKNKIPLDNVNGVTTKESKDPANNVIENLDELKFPVRVSDLKGNDYKLSTRRNLYINSFETMSTSRGCPYSCSFCVSGSLRNYMYHKRSIGNIIDELKLLYKRNNVKSIVFYDDSFFSSQNDLENEIVNFCNALKKEKLDLNWQIEMRPNILLATNPDLIKLLFKSGCKQINIGFESANPQLDGTLNKIVSPDIMRKQCQQIVSSVPELRLTGTFIIGWPNESLDSIKSTVEFSKSLPLIFAHFYPLKIYPGTKIFEKLFKDKDPIFWYDVIINDRLPWGEIVVQNDIFDREMLLNEVGKAYFSFYKRPEWEKVAKDTFGNHYDSVAREVSIWASNRFNLKK